MAKKESDKKALKAIDKAVKRAMKNGITGGLVDQTVATAIHAATVKAAAKEAAPKAEQASSPKMVVKAAKRAKKDDGDSSERTKTMAKAETSKLSDKRTPPHLEPKQGNNQPKQPMPPPVPEAKIPKKG
jgi:hypothetical protein